jgi:hypothetical protein
MAIAHNQRLAHTIGVADFFNLDDRPHPVSTNGFHRHHLRGGHRVVVGDAVRGIATPVLIWLPTTRREAGARAALARIHAELEHRDAVPVATAAADLLNPAARQPSPADEVWLPLTAGRTPPRTSPRFGLGELPAVWPRLASPTTADPAGEVGEDESGATAYRLPAPRPIPPGASPNRLRRTNR